ncbi:MAG: hypothetical protein A2X25_02250 [Chloroflexi bacterium GWB2_49_20]|nr:MAG: hypothetical protein A2X25_02250 [Chloroflexi bacterium GWB2_49_20]OGN78266.1 MAG: hypothetical protein A2X26_14855 [Chloroflexi bacterium GWC2_49_37]OGN85302.1 MAG: hypothetical protein A2X27_07510 [Chloroflexi bacterium GWD2_49_16]
MHELVVNLHIHTTYSDGSGLHAGIARTASDSHLDAIIITDHNVLVQGLNGYINNNGHKTLLLVGEEIHDQDRIPQKNHLLVLGITREAATLADDPQELVDFVKAKGGLSFIAHPIDPELKIFNESDISWEDWNVKGFTGIEIWNGFSELKTVVKSKLGALKYAFFPELIAHGPLPQTLLRWDTLLSHGQHVVAIGGSDSHALSMRMGPIRKTIFPYNYHFSAINTHLLTPSYLSGNLSVDSGMIYAAFAKGNAFIGYDLPASTYGFRFSAQSMDKEAIMGDDIHIKGSVTLQVHTPGNAEISLLKDGKTIKTTRKENLVHITNDPGIYRVEVHRNYLGKKRSWIYSNPIYLVSEDKSSLRKSDTL